VDERIRNKIDKRITQVEASGHGEVTIKVRNGYVWRILTTEDDLMENGREDKEATALRLTNSH